MRSYKLLSALTVFAMSACGGGEPAESGDMPSTEESAAPAAPAREAPSGPMTMPEWYVVDEANQTVNLTITAGATNTNNYWNYNGFTNGQIAITVPEGYTINLTLVNNDPNMGHSAAISAETQNFATPPAAEPVFAGAMTENPTSMIDATMPGETETITFVVDAVGDYSLVCLIPGHSAIGMWLPFHVVPAGQDVGVQGL